MLMHSLFMYRMISISQFTYFQKTVLKKIIEMKEEQCHYIDSDLHDLTAQNPAENDESNMLKISKTNSQQNFDVQSDMINKNVSISHNIQIHQNVNSLSMN